MTPEEEKHLIETVEENNRMLKEIIKFINFTMLKSNEDNINDFYRNVLANMISNVIQPFRK